MSKFTKDIVKSIGISFRTFGGGIETPGNPISMAIADKPLMFAAGVDVEDVVVFIEAAIAKAKPQS